MSEELESVGALSTATLAAAALEGDHAQAAHDRHAHGDCANCNAPLAGPFCRMCGQQAHIHRSLLHLVEEFLHGVFHFEAKGWRTIPLLIFKPGALTRRYIDGRRKTYVSPLALFLFMVFLMFFVASLGGSGNEGKGMKTGDAVIAIQGVVADQAKEAAEAKAAIDKAAANLDAARRQGQDITGPQEELDEAIKDKKDADETLQRLSEESAKLMDAIKAAKETTEQQGPAANTTTTAASADAEVHSLELQSAIDKIARERGVKSGDFTWIDRLADNLKHKNFGHSDFPAVEEALRHAVNNPELALYKLKNTTYKYSFMLVPISLPFLWLMFFWRRGVNMFDHAVFVLYSLCFMSLLFDGVMLAGMAGWSVLAANLAVWVPPVHMFVQLRTAYGLGIFSALWRTVALAVVSAIVLVLFLVLVLALSMH